MLDSRLVYSSVEQGELQHAEESGWLDCDELMARARRIQSLPDLAIGGGGIEGDRGLITAQSEVYVIHAYFVSEAERFCDATVRIELFNIAESGHREAIGFVSIEGLSRLLRAIDSAIDPFEIVDSVLVGTGGTDSQPE